jgi:plastocyanin
MQGHTRTDVRRTWRALAAGAAVLAAVLGLSACGDDERGEALTETADIIIGKEGFNPNELRVKVGQEVSFTVLNRDSRPHTFTLTFLDINRDIAPGQKVDVKMRATEVPPAGFYSFYSNNLQHEGYQGRIYVDQ